jgi:sugar lactone lactonase YvrE
MFYYEIRTRLTGNRSLAVEVLVNQDVATPDGLAFDWIHKNLYWTDTGNNRIDVLALAMGGAAAGGRAMRKTLFNVNLDEPRAIVVDPRDDQR